MLIKITKMYDGKIAEKYAAKFVVGTRLDNGEEWEKGFFANKKDLVQKLSDFSVGDECNVVLQHVKDKIYNIVDFREVTDEDKAKLKGPTGSNSSFSTGSVRRPDGGSRGDDTNRSAALYFVKDLVLMTHGDAKIKKMRSTDLLDEMLALSDIAYAYIKDGVFPPPVEGMVEDRDKALDPPEV